MANKHEMLITPDDLLQFLTVEQYIAFIKRIKERSKHIDYDTIRKGDAIWLAAQWGEMSILKHKNNGN